MKPKHDRRMREILLLVWRIVNPRVRLSGEYTSGRRWERSWRKERYAESIRQKGNIHFSSGGQTTQSGKLNTWWIQMTETVFLMGWHGIVVWGYFFSWWLGGMLETSERNNSFWANHPWHGIVSGLLVSDSWRRSERLQKYWGEDSESPEGSRSIWPLDNAIE